MAATIKYGDTKWAVKDGNTLGYNDENRFKPVPFDFTRNSIGTRVDRNGLIETIGNNIPRIDFTDNTDGHLLLEPTSTNEITYSEDFSQTIWTKNDVLVEGGYTAPDGSNTAYKVTNNGGNAHLVGYFNINTGKHKSIWAKTVSGTGDVDLLNVNGNNLFTLTNEWQRFDAAHIGPNFFYAVDFRGASATLSEVIVWGCQLEALSYPTSYIPTNGSTVTRASETCTNAGNSTLINSTEGVLYAEIAALANDGTFRVISINSGDNTNIVKLGYRTTSNAIYYEVRSGNVSQSFEIYTTTDVKEFHKVALLYKENDFKLFVDGVNVLSDTSGSTPIGLNNLSFEANSGAYFYGKVKALTVYNTALTDAELIELTS